MQPDRNTLARTAALVVLGLALLAPAAAVEETRFMRGDTATVNGFEAYNLSLTQSSTSRNVFKESSTGGQTVDWGIRVWSRDSSGTESEITGGSPVAVVSRSTTGSGIQTGTWNAPEELVNVDDSLVVRVYIQVGGNGYTQKAEFTTDRLEASKLNSDTWNVSYYTEYETQTNGPPGNRYTRGTFYWGTSTYNSTVEGINYSEARLEADQLNPASKLDTYPGNNFTHSVNFSCRADSCTEVTVNPQICQGAGCTSFQNTDNSQGITWDPQSYDIGSMIRDAEDNRDFDARPDSEGVYRIRFNVTGSNVNNAVTSAVTVNVSVADVNLTSLEHENRQDVSLDEYEAGDTIEFLNTTLTAFDGKAYGLNVTPKITDPEGSTVSWSPSSTKDCGNLSGGSSCEKEFGSFSIPGDEEPGEYTFEVDYNWKNFGPETNTTNTFILNNLKKDFNASIEPESIFRENTAKYSFNLTNNWSTSITDVNVSINCDESQLNCTNTTEKFYNSVSSGQKIDTWFNVSTNSTTDTGFYDVNVTVNYTNPNEVRVWEEVRNKKLKVTKSGTLVTTIDSQPEKVTRGEESDFNGYLENTGSEAQDVWLNWSIENGWDNSSGDLNRFEGTVAADEIVWNNFTADIQLTADRGPTYINLTSNNSDGSRGDRSFHLTDVYADTSAEQTLSKTDAVRGEDVSSDISLSLDTGADLVNQEVKIVDETSGDTLGFADTDSNGVATLSFSVPSDWSVGTHQINASYSGNDSEYTNPSFDVDNLEVRDKPVIENVSIDPSKTGFGQEVKLNASVIDEDNVSQVYANITYPDGSEDSFEMQNLTDSMEDFEYNFGDTFQNGDYEYSVWAEDTAGYSNTSDTYSFSIRANMSMDVATEKDRYGPNQDVWLNRTRNATRNSSLEFHTITREKYAEDSFSDSYNVLTGTASDHTDTHDQDGLYFQMNERAGEPPSTPDEFEGVYTYKTDFTNLRKIDINSLGNVTGGTWDVYARDYSAGSWTNIYSISSTTDTWDNHTICSGGTCSDYLQNGDVKIRVHTTSDRGSTEYSYNVDFQKLRIETSDGPISENENPSEIRVGQDPTYTRRYYRKFDLSQLPQYQNAEINSAELYFNVSSGFGTGELYHTKNFTSGDSASTIHADGTPSEATQSNPIGTFSTSTGMKNLSVTTAVNDTFEAGKKYAGFQFREQGEDIFYNISSPIYLKLNYTVDSALLDTGSTNVEGYLVMRTQKYNGSGWENVGFPVVDQSNGLYSVNSGSSLDLAQVWKNNGGWNTKVYSSGNYRVLSRFVDSDGNTLEKDSGEEIRDSYEFDLLQAELNLTDIEHENQHDYLINEYGTRDVLNWTNITVNNSQTEAVNVTIDLNVLDNKDQKTAWGPDSIKQCGDVSAGGSCEKRWDNSSSGYSIPDSASSGTFEFNWNATIEAENAQTVRNSSVKFLIHHVPDNFSSVIDDSDNKIYRNESTLYNFTVENPWSQQLEELNVTVNCDRSELNCTQLGGSSSTANIGTLASSGSQEVSFNITTNKSTPTGDYDINATVEYVNPGNERKEWRERENLILGVRIPGALLNITNSPSEATRGTSGHKFNSFANNTFSEDLTDEWINWTIPQKWNNDSGDLRVFESVHTTGEIVYNNFTASVGSDAGIGTRRINISVTNDQGRVDNDFVYVDVYADTYLDLSLNTTDPAVNDTVKLTGVLHYDNGSTIEGEEIIFRDETEGTTIDSGVTDSTGTYSTGYRIDKPLGSHTLNVTYSGSDTDYLRPSFQEQTVNVHDRPNISNVSADPSPVGFGFNTTLNASVEDNDGVSSVKVNITYPNGTEVQEGMTNAGGSEWQKNFSGTWNYGDYSFTVIAEDTAGKKSTANSSFRVEVNQTSSIQTERFDYYPAENVNLTGFGGGWWNKNWDYRRKIEINETSGNQLVKYPTRVEVDNLGSKTSSCNDLRAVEGFKVRDIHVEECTPSGTSIIYLSQNISASATERDVYLYYGNSNADSYRSDTYAYSINDSGLYDPGDSSLDNTHTYNNGNSSFRQIDITVYGSNLDATVTAYYLENDSSTKLYDGAASDTQNIVNREYLDNPLFNKVNVKLSDTSGGSKGDVSYEYNFTTPDYRDAADQQERDRLPSLINNTGGTAFKGRVLLEVASNTSGSWQTVSTRVNDSSPRSFSTGSGLSLSDLWNSDPWYTDQEEQGFYRAEFKLLNPSGNVLSTSSGSISQEYMFKLNPSQTEIQLEDIEIYNVTGAASPKSDTSDLEDSGTNKTFAVKGGETYRFDVRVNNSESAQANWTIEDNENISYFNFNSSWTVNSNDIFYENKTDTFTGGTFNGNVSWNTSLGGKVQPGDSANFSFVVDIPNKDEFRDIEYLIDDSAFSTQDLSELDVIRKEQEPPKPLLFDLNDTEIIRGETLKGYAYWDEEIGSSKAEYNSTTSVLNNFTVSPSGQWTNYTTSTDSGWVRGNHSFRFYASDPNGNQNSTRIEWFEVYGLASVNQSELNSSEVLPGEPAEFTCQVVSDSGNQVDNYNVNFYNETAQIGTGSTNSTGWASTVYSSEQIGYQDLTCNITNDDSRYYKVGTSEDNRTLRVAEEEPPKYFQHGSNVSRIFKTTRNETAKFYANWTDNVELESASLVRGRGVYSFTKNEYIHEINSNTFNLFGALNGTNPINEGFDSSDHYVYGVLKGVNGEKLDAYHGGESYGGWNNTIIANATSQYCAIQTTPVNNSRCQNSGNLVSFFALDETGSKAWDHVGENHGELRGGIFQGTNGYINNAYDFDGGDDYINLSDKPSEELNSSSYTLTAWIRNPGDSKEVIIASNQQNGAVRAAFRVNQRLEVRVDGSTYTATTDVRGSAWTHVVFAYNSSNDEGKFYVNGSSDGNFQDDRATVAKGDIFSIGQRYSGSIDDSSTSEHFDGEMDNVRIYDRQLNQTEIQQLFDKDPRLGDERRLKGDLPSGFVEESLSGSEDWSNLTTNIPDDYPLGDYDWSIYANDTSSNINSTTPMSADIWAWAYNEPDSSGPDKNPVAPDEEFTYYCNYVQGNGSAIRNYDVNFYDNNTGDGSWQKLGTNQTQTGALAGFAEWTKSYSSAGTYDFKCNISASSSRNLEPDPDFGNYSEAIQVNEGDVEPPVIINDNYGMNVSEVYKGETVLSFAEWNETIDYAEVEFNSTNSSLEMEKISGPYTDNWTNATIDTNASWKVGEHWFKTYANDSRGNLNDTLSYLKVDVYGKSRVDWYSPKDNATADQNTELKCRVSDDGSGVNISDYPVKFYDENKNFIDSNQTNSEGIATVTYDTSGLNGDNTFSCTIENEPQLYYNTSSQNSDSETVEILADMNTSILHPSNNTNYTRGETIWLNSTSENTDTGESITPDSVNWTNTTSNLLAQGENTTWDVFGEAGRQNISVRAAKSSYDTGKDYVDIGIFGYSEINLFEPSGGSSYAAGNNVTIRCGVRDNRTSKAVEGYNVDFFVENSTQTWDLGQNQTDSTGNATIEWDTSGFTNGEYYPGCNISDQKKDYFYASEQNETNTTVSITSANGELNGTLTDPFDGASVAQNKTFDANATIECTGDDCGDVTATLRYNASGDTAGTDVSSSSDTPFYTIGSNPKSCGTLNQGDKCNVSWDVNATGDQDTWHALDVEMSGTTAQTNDTEDKNVRIDFLLLLNVNYTKIEFPQGDPGQTVSAPGNGNGKYFTGLDENSNDADGGAWIKMTNLTKKNAPDTDNRNIRPVNTSWAMESACSYAGSEPLAHDYSNILGSMNAGDSFTQCFWQEIPFRKYSGIYNGTLTIKVNATN